MNDSAPVPPPQCITEDRWREIKETLPANIDSTPVRIELERIAHDDATPMTRAKECEERARRCRRSLALVDKESTVGKELARQIHGDDVQAGIFREIAKQRQPRKFLRQYGILELWERIGGELGVLTPRKSKADARWPDPEGPAIGYLQAASKAVFGGSTSASQAKQILRRYRHLKFGATTLSATGTLCVDDSKVFVIPAAAPKKP